MCFYKPHHAVPTCSTPRHVSLFKFVLCIWTTQTSTYECANVLFEIHTNRKLNIRFINHHSSEQRCCFDIIISPSRPHSRFT
ncbi:hypothetical protein D915_007693 [Fasciola hepatica]|uniref:Uncharacterized protein n=1 Tax=Fasciola hepatica TaxID=6192 RepID=A0A4E0R685_FASHE|nr:hypothetical protein D915_007693 [Fasciola hepatica]